MAGSSRPGWGAVCCPWGWAPASVVVRRVRDTTPPAARLRCCPLRGVCAPPRLCGCHRPQRPERRLAARSGAFLPFYVWGVIE